MREKILKSDALIVSETDERGIITYANEEFCKISGYSLDELIGKPHNIIRHPDMPACVFKLLWLFIEQGKPISAYVKNRAKDGSYYWVLANVFPLGDKYVSIRVKPTSSFINIIPDVYKKLLLIEKTQGMDAAATELMKILKSVGFDSYEAFMTQALIEELKNKDILATINPNQTSKGWSYTKVQNILISLFQKARSIDSLYTNVFERIDFFVELNKTLQEKSLFIQNLADDIILMSLNASLESQKLNDSGRSLSVLAGEIRESARINESHIEHIRQLIASAISHLEKIIFRASATKLQIIMIAFFCAELLQDIENNEEKFQHESQATFENITFLLSLLNNYGAEEFLVVLEKDLRKMSQHVAKIDRMVKILDYIYNNGMVEAVNIGIKGRGFVAIFSQIQTLITTAREEIAQMQNSIDIANDETSLLRRTEHKTEEIKETIHKNVDELLQFFNNITLF